MFPIRMRAESGTCNVCSAPCSSCMHYGRALSTIGSKIESIFSSNMSCRRKADSSFVSSDRIPISKTMISTDLQNSEASILISTSSSHDSYSENAESKTNPRASCTYDVSDMAEKHHVIFSSELVEEECSLLRNPTQVCSILHVPASDDLCYRFHSGQGEVQSGFECRGENILLTSGERDTKIASFYKNSCSLHSNTENETSSCLKDGSKEMEGTMNLQGKEEAVVCAEDDTGESPLASMAARSSCEYGASSLTNCEASLLTQRKTLSSCNSKTNSSCQESRKGTDSDKQFDNNSVESGVHDLEIDIAMLDVSKGQADDFQPQVIPDVGQPDADVVLDDVKVCDICGDAGREDLLATCSRCNDGAEHTYCMQEKMDKVPEGDWLCEECKIKDTGNHGMDEPEAASGRFRSTCCNEVIHKPMSTSTPQKLHKLEAKPTYLNSQGWSKGVQSPHISSRRQFNHIVEGNASEVRNSIEKVSPRKKPTFSRQVSLKGQDSSKVKTVNTLPSSKVHSANDSEAVPIPKTYLRSTSFKSQPNLHLPRGILSRSASFSNLNIKPNVKRFTENDLYKQRINKESTSNDLRKMGLVKSMSKTLSFKRTSLECHSTDSASKISCNSPRLEEIKRPKELQERNGGEKKNFSAVAGSFFRPSTSIDGVYSLNVDSKFIQSNFNAKNTSKAGASYLAKGSNDKNDLGTDEGKKKILCSSKIVDSSTEISRFENPKKSKVPKGGNHTSITDGSQHKADVASQNTLVSPSDFDSIRMRDSTIVINSSSSALDENETLRNKKCNDTGHTIQNGTIDKLQGSCKLAPQGNLIEVVRKRNKWRELVDATRALKNKQPDKIEELPSDKIVEMMSKVSSKETLSASCQTNVPLVVDSKTEDSLKDSDVLSIKLLEAEGSDQPTLFPLETSVANADSLSEITTATPLSFKYFPKKLQEFLAKQSSSPSAFPTLEYIWQGSFNVHGFGSPPEVFNGIQAHVSACASHKVSEVVANVPCNFQLEEVSHNSLWPLQFQGISPQEENIALFFFAKDMQSYDRGYKELVERMLRNDSALRGNIDGTELLIFTSTKLPLNSQRWNSMHYLWGMFRVKRRHCLPLMAIQEKPSLPNLNAELISQDLPIWHLKSVPSGTNNSKTSSKLIESVSHGMILRESGDCVEDLHYIASNVGDKKCRTSVPVVENGFKKTANNSKFTEEQLSFAVGNSSGTLTQPSRIVDVHQSKPRCEENSNGIFQEKAVTDCIDLKTGELPVRPYDVEVESSPQRATLILPASQNCNIQDPGAECSSINRIVAEECSPSAVTEPIGGAFETDRISCETSASRKHGRSCSVERVLQPFGEFLMNSAKTELASGWPSWMHFAWETERKKICHVSVRSPSDKDINTRLSSKVHPIHSSISASQEHGELEPVAMANLGTPEMCFFPVDIFPEKNKNLCNNITVSLSSDDNDAPESSTLDLELALGRKSEPKKRTLSMFPAESVHGGQHGHLGNGDASASLSLSLSFRSSESHISDRRILEAEQTALFRPCSFGKQ